LGFHSKSIPLAPPITAILCSIKLIGQLAGYSPKHLVKGCLSDSGTSLRGGRTALNNQTQLLGSGVVC
jgi:hypothetical protein